MSTHRARGGTGLPSVADLGRHLAAVDLVYTRHEEETHKDPGDQIRQREALDLLYDRGEALRDLIATMPARTIQDAAVLVGIAWSLAANLDACEFTKDKTVQIAKKLERIAMTVLPVIAGAAAMDVATMDWTDALELAPHRFHGVEGLV
jgi:hypothetical protein